MYLSNTTIPVGKADNEVSTCFWGIYNELPAAWRTEFEWILWMWFLYFLRKVIELKLKIVWTKGHIDKKLIMKKWLLWRKLKDCIIYSTDVFKDKDTILGISKSLDSKIQSAVAQSCSDQKDFNSDISDIWYEHYIYLSNGDVIDLDKDNLPDDPEKIDHYEKKFHYSNVLDYLMSIRFNDELENFQIEFVFNKTNEEWIRYRADSDSLHRGILNLI